MQAINFLKNWDIKKRLFFLSGSAVGIIAIVGVIAVLKFTAVNSNTARLVDAYLPEWERAESTEQWIRLSEVYRYQYLIHPTDERYQKLQSTFDSVSLDLESLSQLSEEQNLPVLAQSITGLRASIEEYRASVGVFKAATQTILDMRHGLEHMVESVPPFENKITIENELAGKFKNLLLHEQNNDPEMVVEAYQGFLMLSQKYEGETTGAYEYVYATSEMAKMYADSFVNRYQNEAKIASATQKTLQLAVDLSTAATNGALSLGHKTTKTGTRTIQLLMVIFVVAVMLLGSVSTVFGRSISRSLTSVIDRLDSAGEELLQFARQFTGTSQRLAESSSQQAASIQETTSSIEEMASQIKQNNENTSIAETAMDDAKILVGNGVEAIKKLMGVMAEIKESASETSKIISTIDEIAFQTNLLALNAAVEAARAGEAGKGFAVVAEEVRSLAQRSAEAAKNTSELIQRSQSSSESGVEVAQEASENLKMIAESSGKVDIMVKEISDASKEQAQGIDQMTTVMADMDAVVQGNASLSEECASSSEDLSGEFEKLHIILDDLDKLVGKRISNRSLREVIDASKSGKSDNKRQGNTGILATSFMHDSTSDYDEDRESVLILTN